MKICRDCKTEKPNSFFVRNKVCKDGIDTLCTSYNRERVKKWRIANPEKRKIQQQKESDPNKIYNIRKHLKNSYGLTIEDYDNMYNEQQGCCLICKIHQSEINKKFHVDHCHSTDKIRGLLCPDCNHLLGFAKDNTEILKNAIDYLQR